MDQYSDIDAKWGGHPSHLENASAKPDYHEQDPRELLEYSNIWDIHVGMINSNAAMHTSVEYSGVYQNQWLSNNPTAPTMPTHLYPSSSNSNGNVSPASAMELTEAINSSNFGAGIEVTTENVGPSSKKSTSIRSGPKKKPFAERLYECPMCHAGKGDLTKSYPWDTEDVATRKGKDGDTSIEHVWQYASSQQKHIIKYHLWLFRRPAIGDYLCIFCQCTWDPESCARFTEEGEILNHISTQHSDPSKTYHSFDHGCSALIPPLDTNEASERSSGSRRSQTSVIIL